MDRQDTVCVSAGSVRQTAQAGVDVSGGGRPRPVGGRGCPAPSSHGPSTANWVRERGCQAAPPAKLHVACPDSMPVNLSVMFGQQTRLRRPAQPSRGCRHRDLRDHGRRPPREACGDLAQPERREAAASVSASSTIELSHDCWGPRRRGDRLTRESTDSRLGQRLCGLGVRHRRYPLPRRPALRSAEPRHPPKEPPYRSRWPTPWPHPRT